MGTDAEDAARYRWLKQEAQITYSRQANKKFGCSYNTITLVFRPFTDLNGDLDSELDDSMTKRTARETLSHQPNNLP